MAQIRFRIGSKFYLANSYPYPGTFLVEIRTAIGRDLVAKYILEDESFISSHFRKEFPGPWTEEDAADKGRQLFIMNQELEKEKHPS
jgi:hypothetical protein